MQQLYKTSFCKTQLRFVLPFLLVLFLKTTYAAENIFSLLSHGQTDSAINLCSIQIAELKKAKQDSATLFKLHQLFLLKAECYSANSLMENFKSFTDSAFLYLNKSCGQHSIYHAVIYTNFCRYYHYLTFATQANNWGEKARAEYFLHKNQSKKINAFLIYQSIGASNRNADCSNIYNNFDTAFALYRKINAAPDYYGAILYRSYANACMDSARDYPQNLHSPYSVKCKNALQTSLSILSTKYPDNFCAIADLLNLQGLFQFYLHNYSASIECYKKAKLILLKTKNHSTSNLNYANTYLINSYWYNNTLEKIPASDKKIENYKQQLQNAEEAETLFNEYAAKEFHENTLAFRDIYALSPYQTLVPLCFELYSYTHDTTYALKAFQYSEKNRQWNFYNAIAQEKNLAETTSEHKSLSLSTLQSSLSDTSAIIEYFENTQYRTYNLYAFIITAKSFHFVKLPKIDGEKEWLMNCQSNFGNISGYKKTNFHCYQLLFHECKNLLPLNIKDIALISTGVMSGINFDAILCDTIGNDYRKLNYLFNHYNIHYSLSAIPHFKYIKNNPNKQSIFIIPTYSNQYLIQLYNIEKCISKWQNKIGGQIISGTKLAKNYVLKQLQNKYFIQLSGHTKADESDADLQHFYLQDNTSDSSDLLLTQSDIIHSPIIADLVLNISCQTGKGDADRNEGMQSFARAFTYAGAHSVIFSLFKADDKSTATITNYLYENFLAGEPKHLALYHAKQKYLSNCKTSDEASPIYWANLQLLGETNPMQFQEASSHFIIWRLVGGFLFLVMLLYLSKRTA